MPALTAAGPRLAAAAATARELHAAITFRLQWTWRIPATRRLAATLTPLGALDHRQLGIIAGHLRRTRCRRTIPAGLATGSYGLLHSGTVTATTSTGQALTLTRGTTWTPHHTLHHASPHATLIHIHAHEIRQHTSNPPGQ
jgi:hypothetical protein